MKLKTLFPAVGISISLLLSGCSSTGESDASADLNQMGDLILVEPLEASARNQMNLARLSHFLNQIEQMSEEQRAELLYRRGTIYDSLGLRGLAYVDFDKALTLKPDMAEAHNFVGIHHTQNSDFLEAYDAFDSALEIQPDHDFALLNRGIALYYGGRSELGMQDLKQFYDRKQSDPFRALWLYIAEREVAPEQALSNLKEARGRLSDSNWATSIVDFYLGDISELALKSGAYVGAESNFELTRRLCEVYFYLGKHYLAKGKPGRAKNYFKLSLSTNVYDYVEHRYSKMELKLLRRTQYN